MKRYMKKIAVVIFAVMLFSALSGYALAGSNQVGFSKYMTGRTWISLNNPQYKNDASDVFVEFDKNGAVSSYRVRALGCKSDGTSAVNYTYYNNRPADYVGCYYEVAYGIQTVIFERSEYKYANLSIMGLGGNGITSGWWSSDTVQNFGDPNPPE